MDCGLAIAPPVLAFRTLKCRHVVHHSCSVCRWPPCAEAEGRGVRPKLPRPVAFILHCLVGMFGAADAFVGDWRRSVMMASSFGMLWLCVPLVLPARWLTGYDATDFVYVALMTARLGSLIKSPELVATLCLWITGRFGFEWGFGSAADFLSSVAVGTALVSAFRAYDNVGSVVVGAYAFWLVWRPPSAWDFHAGNCCGMYTALAMSASVSIVTSVVVSSVTFYTFHGATTLHAWVILTRGFSPQSRDPFDAYTAEAVRSICWLLTVWFFARGVRHNIFKP